MSRTYRPGAFERGGNTKTHGIVRAEVHVRDGPARAPAPAASSPTPRSYPAYVRYSGPGPDMPEDIRDVGFVSMSDQADGRSRPEADGRGEVHPGLVGVVHADLRDPEHARERQAADLELRDSAAICYFLNPTDLHLLDFLMQGLWNETQYNPARPPLLQLRALPARRGPGDAVLVRAADEGAMDIPGVPFGRVPPNYLRDNMVRDAARQRRRVRHARPDPDRPAPNADRERLGALAGAALAVRAGGDAPHPAAEVRHPGADGVRQAL